MTSWPASGNFDTTYLDSPTDDPSLARGQILQAMQDLDAVIESRGDADGVAGLDENALVPVANLPTVPVENGGTGATDAATALANLGAQPALGYDPLNKAGDDSPGSQKFRDAEVGHDSIPQGYTPFKIQVYRTGDTNFPQEGELIGYFTVEATDLEFARFNVYRDAIETEPVPYKVSRLRIGVSRTSSNPTFTDEVLEINEDGIKAVVGGFQVGLKSGQTKKVNLSDGTHMTFEGGIMVYHGNDPAQ